MTDTEMTTLEKTARAAQEIGYRHGCYSGKQNLIREVRRYGFRPTRGALKCPRKAGEITRKYYAIRGKIAEPVIPDTLEIDAETGELIAGIDECLTAMHRTKSGLLNEVIRQASAASAQDAGNGR